MGTSHTLGRTAALLIGVVPSIAVILGAAPPAYAGISSVAMNGTTLVITSNAGGNDALVLDEVIFQDVTVVRVTEVGIGTSSLTMLGFGCSQLQTDVVVCPKSALTGYLINSGDGNDSVDSTGTTLNGTFNGGTGNDILLPGRSEEVFNGGAGTDSVNYSGRENPVTVSLNGTADDGEDSEEDNIKPDVEKVIGTDGADSLTGGTGADTLVGGAGNDKLVGGLGGDVLKGGTGFDSVSYEDHAVRVVATIDGAANDGALGESDNIGTDVEALVGSNQGDRLTGGSNSNVIDGLKGSDVIAGGGGNDTVSYANRNVSVTVSKDGAANDGTSTELDNVSRDVETILGGSAADTLIGSSGADTFDGGPGADDIQGLGGTDTVTYASRTQPLTVTLDNVAGDGQAGENDNVHSDVENVIGGTTTDALTGSSAANRLEGRGGSDTLLGVGGSDVLDGGSGGDTIGGGAGVDTVTYAGRAAPVTVNLDGFTNDGEDGENDTVQTDVENLIGGSGDDSLTGNGAANVLDGGLGADVMDGGDGIDTVTYASRTGDVRVDSDPIAKDGEVAEGDTVGDDIENLTGGAGDDKLTALTGPSVITGGAGDDLLFGSSEPDKFVAGPGDDTMDGGGGTDLYDGGSGVDIVSYAFVEAPIIADLDGNADDGFSGENENLGSTIEGITGGTGKDTLTGNSGANVLDGGFPGFEEPSQDVIRGLGGNDFLTNGGECRGDAGDDTTGYCVLVYGDTGNDDLRGETIYGGEGNDKLKAFDIGFGQEGKDILTGEGFASVLDGGIGGDTYKGPGLVTYSKRINPINATPDGVANDGEAAEGDNILPGKSTPFYELRILGSKAGDTITANHAIGGAGNDIIAGLASSDRLDGGVGNDTILGGGGADVILGGTGNDTVNGGPGDDIVYASDGADVSKAGAGHVDQYVATYLPGPVKISMNGVADDGRTNEKDNVTGFDVLWGTSGGDVLIGASGNEDLYGLEGTDTLSGLAGIDFLFGGLGADGFNGGVDGGNCDYTEPEDLFVNDCNVGVEMFPAEVPPDPDE